MAGIGKEVRLDLHQASFLRDVEEKDDDTPPGLVKPGICHGHEIALVCSTLQLNIERNVFFPAKKAIFDARGKGLSGRKNVIVLEQGILFAIVKHFAGLFVEKNNLAIARYGKETLAHRVQNHFRLGALVLKIGDLSVQLGRDFVDRISNQCQILSAAELVDRLAGEEKKSFDLVFQRFDGSIVFPVFEHDIGTHENGHDNRSIDKKIPGYPRRRAFGNGDADKIVRILVIPDGIVDHIISIAGFPGDELSDVSRLKFRGQSFRLQHIIGIVEDDIASLFLLNDRDTIFG